jgi:hypothetical protein
MPVYARADWKSKNIEISGKDDFCDQVTFMLDAIWKLDGKSDPKGPPATKIGQSFLKELDGAGKKITIKAGSGMRCRVDGRGAYYALLQAFEARDYDAARKLLAGTVKQSEFRGDYRPLATQLATPVGALSNVALSAEQMKALDLEITKVVKLVGPKDSTIAEKLAPQDAKKAVHQWTSALLTFHYGGDCVLGNEQRTLLCRKLESWLDPDKGSPVTIEVDVKSDSVTCAIDGEKKKRPLAIGLAHELIHAYYSVTGTRLYPEGTPEDEALTTGLPPENFRKYSENLFRSVWPADSLDLRLYYRWADASGMPWFLCPACGHRNPLEHNKAKDGQRPQWEMTNHCGKCKKPLPTPVGLAGKLAAQHA